MSQCTSCSGLVAGEVMGVKGFQADLHSMQLSQSHYLVILSAVVIVGKISNGLRPTCAKRQCHDIHFYASCPDGCPVVLSASRQL